MFIPIKKGLAGVAALAAFALGGAAISSAATSSTTSSSTSSTSAGSSAGTRPAFSGPAHGTAAHEDAEKPVTGATAEKVKSAAVKYVGSGTAGAVTTDYSQTGYETTVTKSDGSTVEVHLDSSFQVMGGPNGHGGPPPGGSPSGSAPTGYSG